MSLSQQAVGGVIWASVEKFGGRAIQFISTIVLSRILLPDDFGVLATIAIFFALANTLIDSGFSQALIREKEINESDKTTTFYINLIIAITLFFVLYFSAPLISKFFRQEILINLTRFMALTPLFFSATIVQRALFTHRINFRTQAIINLVASVLSGGAAITLAIYGFGVWALASQLVLMSFTTSCLYWGLNPWIPKGFINKESVNKLFGFGSKMLLTGLLSTGFKQIYKVIIGRLYSPALLGFYSQAENFKNVVSENLVGVLARVIYPTLSKVKDDSIRLNEAYKKILQAVSFFVFPAMIGMAISAEPLIITLIGQKWVELIPILQVLCISGLIYHLQVINIDILKVVGRSDLVLKLELIKRAGVIVAILIGLNFGFWGLIIAQVISSYFALYVNMIYTSSIINYKKLDQIKDVFPVLLLSLPMALIVFGLSQFSYKFAAIELIVLVLSGVISYLGLSVLVKPKPFRDIIYLLRPKFPFLNKINV